MNYTVYDGDGKILRHGTCAGEDMDLQANAGEYVMASDADDALQNVAFDGFDVTGQPVSPRLVAQSAAEKAQWRRPPVPEEDAPVVIKKKDWDELQARLAALEKETPSSRLKA